jgi:hypothetical protein
MGRIYVALEPIVRATLTVCIYLKRWGVAAKAIKSAVKEPVPSNSLNSKYYRRMRVALYVCKSMVLAVGCYPFFNYYAVSKPYPKSKEML